MSACRGLVVVLLTCFLFQQASASDPRELLTEADNLAESGNWDKARDLYAQAEQEFRARGDTRDELYAKFGRLHRDVESGSYATVLREIEADLKRPVVASDPVLKVRALALKGTIDLNVDTAGAEDDFSQILALARSRGDRKWANRAEGELGIVAGINGDLGRAAVALHKAITKAAALHDVDGQVNFSVWLANGMAVNGMADSALHVLDAVEAVKQNPNAEIPVQLYIARIRALVNLPHNAGRSEAKRLIQQALAYAKQNKILGAQTELLNQAGLLARDENALADAEKYFAETANIAEQAGLPRMRAEALLHLCKLYEGQNRRSEALRTIDAAIAEQRKVQEPYDFPLYLGQKAEIETSLGHLRSADALYERASQFIEAMLVDAPSSRVKSSMIATMGDIYVDHFRLAVTRLHDPARAFAIVESARGRALADSLRYSRDVTATKRPSTPAEAEIARIQRTLREKPVSLAESKRLLAKLDDAYNQLIPVEYARNRQEMERLYRPVSLAQLQKSLQPGEVLIEYVLGTDNNSYALEITRRAVNVRTLPPRGDIDKVVGAYVAAIKRKGNWTPLARKLFDTVLAPALSTHPTSITIIPDDSLHLVPFASLLDSANQYAISSMPIALSPSATVLYILRTERPSRVATRPFLGIAYSPDASSRAAAQTGEHLGAIFDGKLLGLPPLPFAAEEIGTAAQIFGAKSVLLTGDQASEAALKAQPLQDFKIIHIAAHGVGSIMEPDRAALVLAPGNATEDGLWQAREIRRTRLSADLVTLSACETGVGRLQGEEGIMNLARTFLVAGAKSVVASLWDTDDRFTASLMTHFYRHIADGQTVAEAMRTAQSDMLAVFGKDVQPYYWAGFTVIGDGTRRVFPQTSGPHLQAAGSDIR
ncbi:MAG: CHAT domain-containing protein [Bryobacteraceae bacterium]